MGSAASSVLAARPRNAAAAARAHARGPAPPRAHPLFLPPPPAHRGLALVLLWEGVHAMAVSLRRCPLACPLASLASPSLRPPRISSPPPLLQPIVHVHPLLAALFPVFTVFAIVLVLVPTMYLSFRRASLAPAPAPPGPAAAAALPPCSAVARLLPAASRTRTQSAPPVLPACRRSEFGALHPLWPPHFLFLARRLLRALNSNGQLKVQALPLPAASCLPARPCAAAPPRPPASRPNLPPPPPTNCVLQVSAKEL